MFSILEFYNNNITFLMLLCSLTLFMSFSLILLFHSYNLKLSIFITSFLFRLNLSEHLLNSCKIVCKGNPVEAATSYEKLSKQYGLAIAYLHQIRDINLDD